MKYFLFNLFLLLPISAVAAVYSHEENGQTIYSDTPLSANASAVNVPTVNDSPVLQTTDSVKVKQSVSSEYKNFSISSPSNGETIQNQPTITVSTAIDPKLQKGNKVQFYLDSKPVGPASEQTSITLNHIDRGQHTVSAAIVSEQNSILKQTESITIYVHYGKIQ